MTNFLMGMMVAWTVPLIVLALALGHVPEIDDRSTE